MNETEVPEPGRRLGDFEIIRELGRGGMGIVYEARQISLNRKVALKVLSAGLGMTTTAVVRFRREAEAAARLHHTNIVPIYATGEADGTHYYAMELVEGPSLNRVIRLLRQSGTTEPAALTEESTITADLPPWVAETLAGDKPAHASGSAVGDSGSTLQSGAGYFDAVARMMAEVADGLDYAHGQGVIHRDVKPSNLLLSPAGRMSINDFGLARMLEQPGMTTTGEFMGSPLYMSPEQITAGRTPLDHRTDIYSLGATLYELLTLRPPFPGERRDQILAQIIHKEPARPRKLNKRVPVDLETICLKAMEKDPDRRYQTAGQLAEDLRRFVNRFAISAKRAGPVTRTVKWVRRRPAVAALTGLVVLVAVVAGVLAYRVQVAQDEAIALQRQDAIDDALLATMSGDYSAAEKHVKRAELLGASVGWVRTLRGQVALYEGHFEEAVDHLEQATLLMPTNVAAAAMLPWAYKWEGRYLDYLKALEHVAQLEPATPEDFLFKARMESDAHPRQALALLDEAIRRRDSALARVLAVEIRFVHATDTGDPSDIELMLEDALIAKRMLPDNPLALRNHLMAQLLAADVLGDLGHAERSATALREAELDAEALGRFSGDSRAHVARGHYFELVGRRDAALEEWRQLALTEYGFGAHRYAQALYARGQHAAALRALDRVDQARRGPWFRWLQTEILAESPNGPERALSAYDDALRDDPLEGLAVLERPAVLVLLGREADLLEACRELGEKPVDDVIPLYPKGWLENVDYFCGLTSAEELLEATGTSRRRLCEKHFYIGLERLAMGDRTAGAQHFRQSIGTHAHTYFEYEHSRIYLRRLEQDPSWPPWIPVKEEDAESQPTEEPGGRAADDEESPQ